MTVKNKYRQISYQFMKRSSSKTYTANVHAGRPHLTIQSSQPKNKTNSTIVHSDHDQHQRTTKKNSISKASSCAKIPSANKNRESQTNMLKVDSRIGRSSAYEQLAKQNEILKSEFIKLQEIHLKDKQKIQALLSKISEQKQFKEGKITAVCDNIKCSQRRRHLEMDLHRERMKVHELEDEKRGWERNRDDLKTQYKHLLIEIQRIKQQN